jgi:hypothetical protein
VGKSWPSGKLEIYIQPHPVIRRMSFSDTMTALNNIRHSSNMSSEFFVEAVAYQQAAIEEMERRAFAVQAMTRSRTSARAARGSAIHQNWDSEVSTDRLWAAYDPATRVWKRKA